jgi:ABC-type polar amino acid transport system ATPase subunit
MDNTIFQISNLTKKFDLKIILQEIHLTIKLGEFVVITGNSGQGKTTFLRILAGLEPFEGSIFVKNGTNTLNFKDYVAYVPQQNSLWDNLTVLENLTLFRESKLSENKESAIKNVSELLNIFHLESLKNRYPAKLSGGEQQRVALARALATDRDFFLLDEITANLDDENKFIILKVLQEMQKKGKSFILITHDIHFAKFIQSTNYRLNDGKLNPTNL